VKIQNSVLVQGAFVKDVLGKITRPTAFDVYCRYQISLKSTFYFRKSNIGADGQFSLGTRFSHSVQ